MKLKLFLTTLTLLTLSILPAQACPSPDKAENALDYQRRDNNRCEGLKNHRISGSFALISFVSRNFTNYNSTLSLKVPKFNNLTPDVIVKSRNLGYFLDDFNLKLNDNWFTFTWLTNILKEAHILPENLQATAKIPSSQPIYLPVILEKASSQYEFVFWSSNRVIIQTFEIRDNQNKVIYTTSRKTPDDGEIKFIWNGSQAKKGRYTLRVEAAIEQQNQTPENISRLYIFEHNPDWLR